MSVSVVIPSLNRVHEMPKVLSSVLAQTLRPEQIIVVDDGSVDGTLAFLNANYPTVTVIRNEKSRGGAIARNMGAGIATAKYIAFLDSDDQWLPDHLKSKVDFLEQHRANGVYGSFYLQGDDARRKEIVFDVTAPKKGELGDLIFSIKRVDARTSTFVFERTSFMKMKFDEQLLKHQDWDLAINFDQQFSFVLHPVPTVIIHTASGSVRMSNSLRHDSTIYFLKKNKKYIKSDNLFLFHLKMLFRCERIHDKEGYRFYMNEMEDLRQHVSFRNRMILVLLKNKILRTDVLHRLKKIVFNR